jgi:translocation and assembly module TamB
VISGSGAVTLDKEGLRVAGRTEVQRAEITLLRDADAPVLAGDVRIKGRKPPAEARVPSRVKLEMDVDFGDKFVVKASNLEARGSSGPALLAGGFQSRITGAIRITSDEAGIPQARGTLRLVDGTYTALGQRLEVVRGTLTFSGPLDNPAFDVLAMRTRQAVEAGVEITGSARAPRVRLVSQPEVPDNEKLSWLAFGRGGQNVDRTMTSVSQLSSPVASFGMQLTRNLYVAYEQSTTGASETMRIYTRLTDHIALQARAGGVSSFHVFYNFTLDRPPRSPPTVPTAPR